MSEKRALPKGWIWAKIGEICGINLRKQKGLIRAEEKKTTFIPMASVDGATGKAIAPMERPYEEVKKGYTFFAEGDVLFAKITPCMQNGKHFIATGLIDGIGFGSTEFHVLRVGESAMPEWLHYYIRQSHILKDATRYFTGTVGQQRIPDSFLKNLEIPLPPLAEQERIAGLLARQMTAVEKARKAAEEKLAAARLLPSALLRGAFAHAQNETLPEGWKWAQLGDIAAYVNGMAFKPSDWEKTGLPIIRIQNLNSEDAAFNFFSGKAAERHIVRPGELLVSWSASLGVYLWKKGTAILNQHIFKVVENSAKVEKIFLFFALQSAMKEIEARIHGATMQHIRKGQFESILIPLPPLAEQKRIADLLDRQTAAAAKAVCAVEGELREIRVLPAALLRQAFAGAL